MSEIDDLYVILRAQTAPILEGFKQTSLSGEELAAKVTAASDEVAAAVDRMAQRARVSLMSVDESTLAARIEFDKLAASMSADAAKMEAATLKAAESNKALGESLAATPAKAGPSAGALGLVALAVAGIGYEVVKAAGNFQASTQKIVSSGGELQANIGDVRKGLLGMAGDVGYSADELSNGFYKASSAGFTYAHGGLDVIRAAAEGAKTEQADLATVTDAVTTTLVDYHLKASDAAMVTTKLVAATSAGKTTFQELAASLHSVMPAASAAHIPLNDILGDISAMTIHGMSAEQVTQNLSDVIKHMQGPTSTQAKELALLGMTTNQLADDLKSKGLSGTLQEISDRIRRFAPPGSDKVILDLRTALNNLSPAVRQLGMHLFDGTMSMKDYTKAAQGLDPISAKQALSFATLAGASHRIGDEQLSGVQVMQNYSTALLKATGDATGLNAALMLSGDNAGVANGAIKTVTDATTEAGNHVKGWGEIQGTFNQKMSEAKAGLGALAIQVGDKLLPAVSAVVGWLATGAQWMAKHQTLATVLAVALGVLAVGFTVAAVAVWAMNAAFLANPITWIVIGIVAIIAGIVLLAMHWKTIWGAIWDFIKPIGQWFAGPFANFFVSAWHMIADAALWLWHNVLDPFWQGLKTSIAFVMNIIDSLAHIWLWMVEKIFAPAATVITIYIKLVAAYATWLWQNIIEPVAKGIGAAISWLWGAFEKNFNLVMGVVRMVGGVFESVFSAIGDYIASGFNRALSIAKWAINAIISLVNGAIGGINSVISAADNIPGVSLPRIPQIPHLAQGGVVPATPGGRLLVAGEAGEDEVVAPLSRLPSMLGAAGGQVIIVENHLSIDGKEIQTTVVQQSQRYGRRNGRTGLTLPAF